MGEENLPTRAGGLEMRYVVHTRPKALPDEPTGLYMPGEDTALKYFETVSEAREFWVNYSEVPE